MKKIIATLAVLPMFVMSSSAHQYAPQFGADVEVQGEEVFIADGRNRITQGSVHVYTISEDGSWTESVQLRASDAGDKADGFGQALDVSGDFLVVGIHADDVVMSYKRRPILTMEERVKAVSGCRYVDEVIPNAPLVVDRAWIERHRIDLVVHADDFDEDELDRLYRAPREMGIFRTVPYTHGISTTEIIERIRRADA